MSAPCSADGLPVFRFSTALFGVFCLLTTIRDARADSIWFNGTNAYCRAHPIHLRATNALTLEAWVRPTKLTNTTHANIIRQQSGNPLLIENADWLLSFRSNGSRLVFGLRIGPGDYQELAAQVAPGHYEDGDWHHIAATYDGQMKRLYHDGVEIASAPWTGNIYFSSSDLLLGGCLVAPEFYNGLIDEVRIWQGARTPSELVVHMHRRLSGSEPGLVGYWRCDREAANYAADAAGDRVAQMVHAQWNTTNAPLNATDGPPLLTTAMPLAVQSESANPTATVDPLGAPCLAWFEYGLTPNLGLISGATNLAGVHRTINIATLLSNLEPSSIYYIRAAASNEHALAFGQTLAFATAPAAASGVASSAIFWTNTPGLTVPASERGISSHFTLEAWTQCAPTGLPQTVEILRGGDYWNPDYRLRLLEFGTVFEVLLTSGNCGNQGGSAPIDARMLTNGGWHHLAATYDGRAFRLYADGALLGTVPTRFQDCEVSFNNSVVIGSGFRGALDELRAWRLLRTGEEIAAGMAHSLSGGEVGLVWYWRFDEGAGATTADNSLLGPGAGLKEETWIAGGAPVLAFAGVPVVFTGTAEQLTTNSAVLTGKFSPSQLATSAWFEYGTNLGYGLRSSVTIASGLVPVPLTNTISGLAPAMDYHYRLVGSNVAGVRVGTDATFLTQNIPGAPGVLWSCDLPWNAGLPFPSPAVDAGRVYVSTRAGLFAVTNAGPSAGVMWTNALPGGGAPSIGADGTIYFSGQGFHAVNSDGSTRWSHPGAGVSRVAYSTPAISIDGTIYVVLDGKLRAFDASGFVRWIYALDDQYPSSEGSPVIGPDGTIYVLGSANPATLFALAPSGKLSWSRQLPDFYSYYRNFSAEGVSPALEADGSIYTGEGQLTSLSPDGALRWSRTGLGWGCVSPIIAPGLVYATDSDRRLYAFEKDGDHVWQSFPSPFCLYRMGCAPGTPPAVDSAGRVYYPTADHLVTFTPKHQEDWRFTHGKFPPSHILDTNFTASAPVITSDGTIYTILGWTVYAFAGSNRPAKSSWPMYQQNARHTASIERCRFGSITAKEKEGVTFSFFGHSGRQYSIETSTNLCKWVETEQFIMGPEPVVFSESFDSGRFFRAKEISGSP